MLLRGKNIILTGCNRGIGKAMLKLFATQGAHIWACMRNQSEDLLAQINDLSLQHDVQIKVIELDLANEDSIKNAAKQITSEKIPISGLVNNAGLIETGPALMTKAETLRNMSEINYFSPIIFSQIIARSMLRHKNGSIVNISSSAAIEGNEGRIAYAGAKAALITSSKVMARELGQANIRVNAIAPGLTQTEMMSSSTPADALEKTVERLALKRVAKPEEIASVALFLLSDLSSYITGQVICADGGM